MANNRHQPIIRRRKKKVRRASKAAAFTLLFTSRRKCRSFEKESCYNVADEKKSPPYHFDV
jgi:hypothetical protein